MPCSSAAATTSPSRTDPPGWTTAATPAAASTSSPSRKGKKASLAAAAAPGPVPGLAHGDLRPPRPGSAGRHRRRRPGRRRPRRWRWTTSGRTPARPARGRATASSVGAALVATCQSERVVARWSASWTRKPAAQAAQLERARRYGAGPRAAGWPCAGRRGPRRAAGSNAGATTTSAWGPSATARATSACTGRPGRRRRRRPTPGRTRAPAGRRRRGRRRAPRRTGWRA